MSWRVLVVTKSLAVMVVLLLAVGPLLQWGPAEHGAVTEPMRTDVVVQDPTLDARLPAVREMLRGIGDSFIENGGQLEDPAVLFYTQGGPVSIGLTCSGIIVVIREDGPDASSAGTSDAQMSQGTTTHFAVTFDGCNQVQPTGRGPLARSSNYFHGNDPSRWVRGARSFTEVVYEGLYDGVDLVLRLKGDALKYDLLLGAGADAGPIAFRYENVLGLALDGATGDLIIRTASGELRDGRPVVFQEGTLPDDGACGRFRLVGEDRVGFELPSACSPERPILIDPGLVFSTFLAGSGKDIMCCVDIDRDGDIIVSGWTTSADFPMTDGSYDPVGNATLGSELVVSRLNASGHVRYSTYFGGHRDEGSRGVKIAPDGSIIIVGESSSADVYVTADAVQSAWRGAFDALLLRLSSDLSQVLYSSYFGGSLEDDFVGIDLDEQGRACISGLTNSSDIETTSGAYCRTYVRTGEDEDSLFVCRFSSALTQLQYCTYLNGFDSSWLPNIVVSQPNTAVSQAIDSYGRLYVAGKTHIQRYPVSTGAYQTRFRGGDTDGFIALFEFDGAGPSDLVASTYFGGEARDEVMGIDVLDNGNVCVNVATNSSNLEVSDDAPYKTQHQGDAFIAILDWNLTNLVFGTFFGGLSIDTSEGLARSHGSDIIYLIGSTASSDLNLTPGCFDNQLRSFFHLLTRFIVAFNTSSKEFGYCTLIYHGISYVLNNNFCKVDSDGSLVMVGPTHMADLPITKGAYQEHFLGGEDDGYVMRLDPRPCGLPDPPRNLSATRGDKKATLSWDPHTNIGYRVLQYVIYRGTSPESLTFLDSVDGGALGAEDFGLSNGVTYYYGVAAVNSKGEGPQATVNVTPMVPPGPPRTLALGTGDGSVYITWTPPTSTGGWISGYHVLKGSVVDGLERIHTTDASASSYRDTSVVKGIRYYYGVCAFNDAGNGTVARDWIVPRSPPSPPRNFTLDSRNGMVRVAWGSPTDDGGGEITGYNVYIRDALTNQTRVFSLAKDILQYDDQSVRNGGLYYYFVTVLAKDSAPSKEYESEPTPTLLGRPIGPPSAPTDLVPTVGDKQVRLDWNGPLSNNGAPITGYVILWGRSPGALDNRVVLGNQTYGIVALPENGVTYYFQVVAVNDAGQSQDRADASGTPLGVPGKVEGLTHVPQEGAVLLKWSPPTDKGGATSLRYIISKRMLDYTYLQLDEVVDAYEFPDANVEVGKTYVYHVFAANALFNGTPAELSVLYVWLPGVVTNLTVTTGDGLINLQWSPPQDNGGSNITAYFIWKKSPDGTYNQLNWTLLLTYIDRDVKPGDMYWYYIIARNVMGNGPIGQKQNATVQTHPGTIVELQIVNKDGVAELSWIPPNKQWGAPPTGYLVLRGTTPSELLVIADLGLDQTYRDSTVEKGIRYYYRVVAKSTLGQGDPVEVQEFIIPAPKQVPLTTWAALALIVVVVILGVVLATYMRRRGDAAAGAPTVHIVEEVLVVLGDGRLISAAWREESRSKDADLMSGMLVAIQGIAREGLERGGMLRSIKYEDNTIVMAGGQMIYMAAVVYGNPDAALPEVLEATVAQLEATYAPTIETWDGDPSVFAGIEDVLRPIIDRTKDVTREDVQRAGAAPREVELTQ
jgi:hypothetical protein